MKTIISAFSMTMICSAALAQDISKAFETSAEDAFQLAASSLTFGIARMSQHSEFEAFGPTIELGLVGKIGTVAGSPLYLEWAGYFGRANSLASSTQFQGSNTLVYTSSTSPVGTVDLSTFVDGTGVTSNATVQVFDSTGDVATISSTAFSPVAQGTAVSQFAVSQTDSGGVFTALTTNGQTGLGSAYGAVFDDSGFLFLGTGPDSETSMKTTIGEKISASNHTLFFSTVAQLNEQWTVSPRVGPTFRDLERSTTSQTTIDLNEGSDLTATLPDILLAEKTALNSEYHGIIFGADFTRKVRENLLFSIGTEAGLAKFSARSNHSNSVSIEGINVDMPGSIVRNDGTATLAKITGDLTYITQNGAIITLGAFVDYLSDAPYVVSQTIGQPALTGGGSSLGLTGNGETYRTYSIESRSMVSAGINLSAVYLF